MPQSLNTTVKVPVTMQNFTSEINGSLAIKGYSEEKKAQQRMSAAPPSNQAHQPGIKYKLAP
jgi:hypothetical protein